VYAEVSIQEPVAVLLMQFATRNVESEFFKSVSQEIAVSLLRIFNANAGFAPVALG